MKKIIYNVTLLLAVLFVCSCSNEIENEEIISNSNGKTLIANITEPVSGDVKSRTNISSSFKFTWADGDILGIYPEEGDQIYFKITKGVGTNTATFDGGGWALKSGHTYYSYYPFNRENFSSEDTKEAISVSIEGQSIDGDNMFGHLGKHDPMFAQSENTTGSIAWDFQHLVSWLKLKVTLPVDCNISKIVLSNADGLLHTTGIVDITASLPTITATNNLKEISIPCENLSVKANEEIVIPIAIIPTNLTGKTISIKLFTDYFDYSFDLSVIKEWLQGYFYSQELTNSDEILTYNVASAGTLPELVGETRKFAIDRMKIIGNLNGTDIKFIREMAGSNYGAESTEVGALRTLDISNATIVEDDNTTYLWQNIGNGQYTFKTENNVIGPYMFVNTKLEKVILPTNITVISDKAFYDCKNLTSINLPESITELGNTTFGGCSSLTSITLPSNLTTINGTFWGCSSLASIIIPNNVTKIESGSFSGCAALTNITIPNGVITIGQNAFYNCSSLSNVSIPNSVTDIGDYAFENCNSLTSITVPATTIGFFAFYGCSSLTNITIGSNVSTINNFAFQDCTSLTKVEVKATVPPVIGANIFSGCNSNLKIYVPAERLNDYKNATGWKDLNLSE